MDLLPPLQLAPAHLGDCLVRADVHPFGFLQEIWLLEFSGVALFFFGPLSPFFAAQDPSLFFL